jgi:hypothetical protein
VWGVLIDTKSSNLIIESDTRKSPYRWHAVTIVAPANACEAALARAGKRFLSSEAPRLPLKQCDAARCHCKYRHFADRRGEQRRAEEAGAAKQPVQTNRRQKRGRRATD